jgi:hypothetical protein
MMRPYRVALIPIESPPADEFDRIDIANRPVTNRAETEE